MGIERKTQLYFHEDRTFEFIKRPLKYGCLMEMDGERIKRAWPHYYHAEIPFEGYKGISAGTITLGFARDIILDPYDKIPKGTDTNKKPDANDISISKWIANKATMMRQIYRAKRTTTFSINLFEWVLLGILAVEVVVWGIRFGTGG